MLNRLLSGDYPCSKVLAVLLMACLLGSPWRRSPLRA